ncbi:MAG TPA: glycerate kinase, partial [bacterium]|nr:glycerate kinase [bacterium]
MRILIAPDSFKGSLSSQQAATAMSRAVHRCLPEWEVEIFP